MGAKRFSIFLEQNKINKNTYLKAIRLIKQDKSIDFIMKELFLTRHVVNQCLFYKIYVSKSTRCEYNAPVRYWKSEDEMIIQEYRAEDLTGEEKEILKKLKK